LISDIPAGDGKTANSFLQCIVIVLKLKQYIYIFLMLATRINVTDIKIRLTPMTLKDGWKVSLISPDSTHNYFPHEGKVCRRHPDSIGLSKKWGHRRRLILNQLTLS